MPLIPRTLRGRARWSSILSGAVLLAAGSPARAVGAAAERPSLVLITMDTTRADHVGKRIGAHSLTPQLDALARGGTRFTDAVTAAPLTLPAHCSLLTGLTPPAHGVRDNGLDALSSAIPTLASVLSARGYATGAFVSSRVLDRRFGLDRGFATYDDQMVAERVGEHGYPERDARAVTSAALAWVATIPRGTPYFLWVHYYDPHFPYRPPNGWAECSGGSPYAGEVAYMDSQIGRLVRGLPDTPHGRLTAAVGDHGEMLGEHGEEEHGVFVYRSSLAVPLILAGPGVRAGVEVRGVVGTRALPATLLELMHLARESRAFGTPLPGIRGKPVAAAADATAPVYSETFLPANSYGWSPLRAVTDTRWRYIDAPRPELYELASDPAEARNLVSAFPAEAARLKRVIDEAESGARPRTSPDPDPELAATLRSLGYLSGASPVSAHGIDPKDGIALLREFEEAKDAKRSARILDAVSRFESLVRRSPGNVPFLMRLGDAQLEAGMPAEGMKTLRAALALSPRLDFVHVRLAQAYAEQGSVEDARRAYRRALEINPRSAPAWSGLAEIARRTSGADAERKILQECEAAGTRSATLLARLAELERASGDASAARRDSEEAARRGADAEGDAAATARGERLRPVPEPKPRP